MIIIGFTHKTSKVFPRIFCRNFRHVAVIYPMGTGWILYQFVQRGKIVKIKITMRDIKLLEAHGWRFVYLPGTLPHNFDNARPFTCVQLAKYAIGMRNFRVQTPYALYKKIRQ